MKRLVCALLAAMLLIPAAASAQPGAYEFTGEAERRFVENLLKNKDYQGIGDTSAFEGHSTYLLEENFYLQYYNPIGEIRPAGWEVDRRGGHIRSSNANQGALLADGDPENAVTMRHDLLAHKSGDWTLETAFLMRDVRADGFYYEISGEGAPLLRLETRGEYFGAVNRSGGFTPVEKYTPNENTLVKVVVHLDENAADIAVSGTVKSGVPLGAGTPAVVDRIETGTSGAGEMGVAVGFVHVWVNYLVNERFLTANQGKTPYDWTLNEKKMAATGVDKIESQVSDVYSYKLSTTSALEAPRLTKAFGGGHDKLVTEFYALFPKRADGAEARLLAGGEPALTVRTTADGRLVGANGETVYADFLENLWYRIKLVTDTEKKTADIYVNYNLAAENIPLSVSGAIDAVQFTSGKHLRSVMWVDDVSVRADLPLPAGYPEAPRAVKPAGGGEVGMVMYSMWREGIHYGWDRVSPYDERTPYLGYYTEGSAETADWETKWLLEHGVTYQIVPFSGIEKTVPTPIKKPVRSQAWIDGLLTGAYSMDFSIMWCSTDAVKLMGYEDFEKNILPFWIEYCFKNPNYKTIDNKLLLYSYDTPLIVQNIGGEANFIKALARLEEEAKKLGFDGVMFVASENMPFATAEKYGLNSYHYCLPTAADNEELVIAGIGQSMSGEYKGYIPSIPMGFDTNAWDIPTAVSYITPEGFARELSFLSQNREKWAAEGRAGANMLVLTCWNEWGEGHFFCPSRAYGFSYLNAVRTALTGQGVLYDEHLPNDASYTRLNVLYPIGRRDMKMQSDPVKPDMDKLELMQRIDFSLPEDYARCEIEKDVLDLRNEDGVMAATAAALRGGNSDPSVFVNGIDLDAARIKMIKIGAWQEKSGPFTVYYQTTDDPDMGKNGKAFVGAVAGDAIGEFTLLPKAADKLTGRITRLRLDPLDGLEGEFKVSYIELYGSDERMSALYINGKSAANYEPVRLIDGVSYMPVYRYFYVEERVPVKWHNREGRLHIDYNGSAIELYGGKREWSVNGVQKTFRTPPFFENGNLFVPMREFFESFGFCIGWSDATYTVSLESPRYQRLKAAKPRQAGVWEFDTEGDLEGWTYFPNNVSKVSVSDGAMRVSATSHPSIIMNGLTVASKDCSGVTVRVKNRSDADTMLLYFTNESFAQPSLDTKYIMPITRGDGDYKEYTFDLRSNPNYKGTIASLRIDFYPMGAKPVYIDRISLVDES